ncbi:MAG TPA: GDP-L-fucose synthase [Nitrospirae bacterium]|nr:GDP-L-fucose synthase [Nitrospirota bacterium]
MNKDSKIYVAGHRGLVGSAIARMLGQQGYKNIITRAHSELDLTRQKDVEDFLKKEKPEYVFLAAARVGGILANIERPASFIYDNLIIQSNIIHSAYISGVKRLLYVSSSCSYPRLCSQPMKEDYILDGHPEPTNEYYAVAKIAGMKMVEAYSREYGLSFITLIFPNLFGPGDNFDMTSSHVIPALIRKIYEAKINSLPGIEIWGTGRARREFLYVDDVADACLYFIDKCKGGEILNVGSGNDITIKDLAGIVKEIAAYEGSLVFNTEKPDGMPRKLLDVSRMREFAWRPKISLEEGIKRTLYWYISNYHGGD